ncbi:hypothetical protein RFI_16677 [Reticulomyxa filosa]|uniref:Uncharacterized protein n=1 Tax=Reticulomyxa filosa TaxID=46433 RepID=X6N5F6_RETFI|nr:hypothetical protein RFI_16677 [Reticulomyxa filosa]|eukprot:ETO20542.1 hypothetical protein RFI_16677 [Reticulomyxa filosa]
MLGIILHEQLLSIAYHGVEANFLQKTFNFDLLKQFQDLKASFHNDISNTMLLLECDQYTMLVAHYQNSRTNKMNKPRPGIISESDISHEREEWHENTTCWMNGSYESIAAESMEKDNDVNTSILPYCIRRFQSDQSDKNGTIYEFAVFLEYHCHYNTVISMPTPTSPQGECLLTTEMFTPYGIYEKDNITYIRMCFIPTSILFTILLLLFRSTFSIDDNKSEKESANTSIAMEQDLIAREIDELELSDTNEDERGNDYNSSDQNCNTNVKGSTSIAHSKLELSLFG